MKPLLLEKEIFILSELIVQGDLFFSTGHKHFQIAKLFPAYLTKCVLLGCIYRAAALPILSVYGAVTTT